MTPPVEPASISDSVVARPPRPTFLDGGAITAGPLALVTGCACGVLAILVCSPNPMPDVGELGLGGIVGTVAAGLLGAPYVVVGEILDRRTAGGTPALPWVAAGLTLATFSTASFAEEAFGAAVILSLLSPLLALEIHAHLIRRGLRPRRVAASVAGTGLFLWATAVAWHVLRG